MDFSFLDESILLNLPWVVCAVGFLGCWAQYFEGCGVQTATILGAVIAMSGGYFTYGSLTCAGTAVMLSAYMIPSKCPLSGNASKVGCGFFALAVGGHNLAGVSYNWTGFVTAAVVAYRGLCMLVTLKATFPLSLIFEIIWRFMPRYAYTMDNFFMADSPTPEIEARRRAAFEKLSVHWGQKWAKSKKFADFLSEHFSDARFASANRVFYPFSPLLQEKFEPTTVVERTERHTLIDIDGNRMCDIGGSYGVNLCGYDQYKKFLTEGWEKVKYLGCVLGSLHPVTKENIEMLQEISGHPEVSFHMSGTEAVMAAVRMARHTTGKKLIVIFGGAYHGWWDGVQTSAGNSRIVYDVLTVKDMDPTVLTLLKLRGAEIAAVMVNPLQAFHLNKPPPSDLVLASNVRDAGEATGFGDWLRTLRSACHDAGVMFILDEVYTGFRLKPGGAQEYFGVKADLVVYGKTLGGGMPVGVVCGPKIAMARGDGLLPLRVNYIVGTFSAHPLTMASMNGFLKWSTSAKGRKEHDDCSDRVTSWADRVNARLTKEGLPLQVSSYCSVWTMLFQQPGRYHWFLQYYLRDEGINLSWVGTGRLNFSMDFTTKDLDEVTEKMVKACKRMQEDGWWLTDEEFAAATARGGKTIQINLVKEIVGALITNAPLRLKRTTNAMLQLVKDIAGADSAQKKKK